MLVFLNGRNDLDVDAAADLNQMETVGSTDRVNVVVQWASLARPKHTTRMLVKKDHEPRKVTSPVLMDLGSVDMGDAGVLKDFLLWGIRQYPARRYMVVVWDHGTGWHDIHTQDISWDQLSGNTISTERLGQVMRDVALLSGRAIDIYGSDACLMQMGEVAAQMAGAVDYFAGSQDYIPEAGWPYDTFLATLTGNPAITPAEALSELTDQFVKSYAGREEVVFSSLDMRQWQGFEAAVKNLSDAIARLPQSEKSKLGPVVKETQKFAPDDGDVGDFVRRLRAATDIHLPDESLNGVTESLRRLVITNRMTKKYRWPQGLSLWLPRKKSMFNRYKTRYSGLDFDRRTGWSSVLSSYL